MQKTMKFLLIGFISIIMAGTFLACSSRYNYPYGNGYNSYGNNSYGNGYSSERQAYEYGYREGQQHGYYDVSKRAGFEYRDDRRFQNGISRDGRANDAFREGYKRGYEAGYYGRRY